MIESFINRELTELKKKKEPSMSTPNLPLAKIDYDQYFSVNNANNKEFSVLELGDLAITSGKIIAADPLVFLGKVSPFTQTIKPGKYPVKICVYDTDMGAGYAFAKLEITKEKAEKWELAITERVQDRIHELKDDQYFGFPVDAGYASLCDNDTQELYRAFEQDFIESHPDANMYDDFFYDKLQENVEDKTNPNAVGKFLDFALPDTENNIIIFQSGFGDGYYPAYWGYDTNGNVTALVIDFLLLSL